MKKAITLLAVSAVGLALSEEFADNNLVFDDFGDNYLSVAHKKPQQAQTQTVRTQPVKPQPVKPQPVKITPPKPQPVKINPSHYTPPKDKPSTTTHKIPSTTTTNTYKPSQTTYKPAQTTPTTKDRPHTHPDTGKPIQPRTTTATHTHPDSTVSRGKTNHVRPTEDKPGHRHPDEKPGHRHPDGKPVGHTRPKDSEHPHRGEGKVPHKRPVDKAEHDPKGHHDSSQPSKKHNPPKGSEHHKNGTLFGPNHQRHPGNHTRPGHGPNGNKNRTRSAGHLITRGGKNLTDIRNHPRSNRTISEGRHRGNNTRPLTRAELKERLEMEKLKEKMLAEEWKRQRQEMNRTINAKQDLINQLQNPNKTPGQEQNNNGDKGPGTGPGNGNGKGDNTKPGPGGPGAADPNAAGPGSGPGGPGAADPNAAGPGAGPGAGPVNSGPAPGAQDNTQAPAGPSNGPGFQMPQISLPDLSQLFQPKTQQEKTTTTETKTMPNMKNPIAEDEPILDGEDKPKEKPVPKKPVTKKPEPKKPEQKEKPEPKKPEPKKPEVKNSKPETYTLDELESVFKHITENPKALANTGTFDKTLSAWKEKNKNAKKVADPDGDHYTKQELETFYNYMRFNTGSEKLSFAKVWDKWDAWKSEKEKGLADNNLMHLGTLLEEARSFKKAPEEKKFLGKLIQ